MMLDVGRVYGGLNLSMGYQDQPYSGRVYDGVNSSGQRKYLSDKEESALVNFLLKCSMLDHGSK